MITTMEREQETSRPSWLDAYVQVLQQTAAEPHAAVDVYLEQFLRAFYEYAFWRMLEAHHPAMYAAIREQHGQWMQVAMPDGGTRAWLAWYEQEFPDHLLRLLRQPEALERLLAVLRSLPRRDDAVGC